MRRRETLRAAEPYLFILPAVSFIAAVVLLPLLIGLAYAFLDVKPLDPLSGDFVGLNHFRALWSDAAFRNALHNTLVWTFVSLGYQFALGLGLALLLNQEFRGRSLVQLLVFLPWAVPSFLAGLNWAWMFDPAVGPLPRLLHALGVLRSAENLLSHPTHALWGPIIANIWWGIPFFAITLLAALKSIPEDLYEAAAIDGAGEWQQFRSITLPLLAPTIIVTVLLRAVWIANFADLIVVMTQGGPADSTQILASYIFTQAFLRLDFGYASAIALVLLILLLLYAGVVFAVRSALRSAPS